MIQIDEDLCTGCGACAAICPRQAIHMSDGCAIVADELCDDCGKCTPVCPQDAILWVDVLAPSIAPAPPATREPEPETTALRVPTRAVAVLPLVGSALLWAGREIVPRVADLALDVLARRTTGRAVARGSPGTSPLSQRGGRHRQRQRKQGKG